MMEVVLAIFQIAENTSKDRETGGRFSGGA
jgi:hypothetical protein